MEQRIFHGDITPNDLAQALIGEFNKGNWRAQKLGSDQEMVVQIATREYPVSGGQTALAVTLRKVEDGVAIQIGNQSWFGVAASLGQTALSALRNPWSLLERLDDLAQDVENLKLSDEVWQVLEKTAEAIGASFELSERLRRLVCEYCLTANPVGEPACIACGAPLGRSQPRTCQNCGFVVMTDEKICPNCKKPINL
jgi:hypothetical protein